MGEAPAEQLQTLKDVLLRWEANRASVGGRSTSSVSSSFCCCVGRGRGGGG